MQSHTVGRSNSENPSPLFNGYTNRSFPTNGKNPKTAFLPKLYICFFEDCKFDFEDGIDGWLKTGAAFDNQPTFGDNPTARSREPAHQQGDWWIGGYEDRPSKEAPAGTTKGDGPQGTLTLPSFKITGGQITFLIGGGCDVNIARAELIIANQVRVRVFALFAHMQK